MKSYGPFHVANVWQVCFDVGPNDNLGVLIRGGVEYGLGIFVAAIDKGSVADRHHVKVFQGR